LQNLHTFVERW